MRKLLFIILLLAGKFAVAQTYNNEWIDYSKTYYKFKVGSTGLYRITGTNLPATLSSVSADQFQLWRNGAQVPLYTSVASGALGSGYIEFWGQKNDGKPDQPLYLNASFQLSDKLSLETDTAAYFLAVNTNTASNLRFINQTNPVAGNVLPPSPYFMYTARQDYKQMINKGVAIPFNVYVYSSSYDEGEWWSSLEFKSAATDGSTAQPLNYTFSGLKPFTAGPTSTFRMSVAGSSPGSRTIRTTINGNNVLNNALGDFAATIMTGTVTTTSLTDNSTVVANNDVSSLPTAPNRAVAGFMELTYPRLWDFNNQNNFEFSLPSSSSTYIEISNFNAGSAAPVLYDLTNRRRYVADVLSGKYRFVLPADAARDFVLVSQDNGVTTVVQPSFQLKTFVNYSSAANQGDYLIITNSLLRTSGDPVESYRIYRSSSAGGSYNAKIYDIDELTDQFAFGIRKHPLSIKNFLRFARATFSAQPKLAYLIGRGTTYDEYYSRQGSINGERLNLIPTFGYPGSDVLLSSNDNNPIPATPIGRLAAITPQEVADYLVKVKDYELAQKPGSQTLAEKKWMKNIVHIAGGNDDTEDRSLQAHLNTYKSILEDSLYGGKVYDFNKTTTGAATTISEALLASLLTNGIGMLTYFGHGASNSLNYNLPAVNTWNNQGKYPLFLMLGCNVGNVFSYDEARLTVFPTLSERYVLTPQTGGIGMVASSHFGTEGELDAYATNYYNYVGRQLYNQPIANAIKQTDQTLNTSNALLRLHLEQHLLHGDPALKANSFAKPDYVLEESQIVVNPSFISVADTTFNVKIYLHNIGKAVGNTSSTVSLEVKRQYPDGSMAVVYTKNIQPAIRNVDSVSFTLPIVPTRDKGQNKLIVTIDNNNQYDELSETNNSNEKPFFIFEDELRPVYPYNFAIINKSTSKLIASTADPLLSSRTYLMEFDTTELFNSASKISRSVTSFGGAIEFDPGITYKDSTVYYWRVAIAPTTGTPHWNNSSFVYLNGTGVGFNQSHYYQFAYSDFNRMYLDNADRVWKFLPAATNFVIYNKVSQPGDGDSKFSIAINGDKDKIKSACVGRSLIINVFDPITMKPWYNQQPTPSTTQSGLAGGYMNSGPVCATTRQYNFEWSYLDATNRNYIKNFLDAIPNGMVITVRNITDGGAPLPSITDWKNDASIYGSGNTLYDRLKSAGFSDLDSFNRLRAFAFIYKKNNSSFTPQRSFTENEFDELSLNVNVPSADTLGYVTSPKFGPAAAWQEVKWRGSSLENPSTDNYNVTVIGVKANGQEDVLYTLTSSQQDFNISSVNATTYPYIRLKLYTEDKQNLTPYQLRWWRLYYTPVPEGALAANLKFNFKDTLDAGETLNFAIPFKNVSDIAFANTIKVTASVRDKNNQQTFLTVPRLKALVPNDTAMLTYQISTQNLSGTNTLFIDVNPDNDQPENTHMNNFLYKNFFVRGDVYKPTLDVTFDGVRILSGDIVSAKPHISIKLKDESKFLLLNDTSLVSITLRYPDNTLKKFKFGTDTLQFIPASSGNDNVATADFIPTLTTDGEYELIVTGKDKSGNTAGNVEYHVLFNVYNKPMISNMFNYPNPFTTSTAFVFTITGSMIPQNIKIQILTITGKIVREITKEELGPLNIGRNITEFKWDGTDQYGQKLGNGVYLYRVVTNLNGNSLDKFPTMDPNGSKVNTDQYFNKGYGKMYLMR